MLQALSNSVQPPKGLTYSVLRLVAVLGKSAYGAAIRERLSQHTGSDVPAAHVYVMLRRLEDYGFVRGYEQDPSEYTGRRGRSRRVYEISAPGQCALDMGAKLYEPVPDAGRTNGAKEPGYAAG